MVLGNSWWLLPCGKMFESRPLASNVAGNSPSYQKWSLFRDFLMGKPPNIFWDSWENFRRNYPEIVGKTAKHQMGNGPEIQQWPSPMNRFIAAHGKIIYIYNVGKAIINRPQKLSMFMGDLWHCFTNINHHYESWIITISHHYSPLYNPYVMVIINIYIYIL